MSLHRRRSLFLRAPRAAWNPTTSIPWYASYWADDPGLGYTNGQAVTAWRNGANPGTNDLGTVGGTLTFTAADANYNGHASIGGAGDASCTFGTALSQTVSVICIGKPNGTSFTQWAATAANDYFALSNGGGANWRAAYGPGAAVSAGVTDSNVHTFRAVYNAGSSELHVDGSTYRANPSYVGNNQTMPGLIVGSDGYSYHRDAGRSTAFFGVYSGNVANDPRWAELVAWVSNYYGLTLT